MLKRGRQTGVGPSGLQSAAGGGESRASVSIWTWENRKQVSMSRPNQTNSPLRLCIVLPVRSAGACTAWERRRHAVRQGKQAAGPAAVQARCQARQAGRRARSRAGTSHKSVMRLCYKPLQAGTLQTAPGARSVRQPLNTCRPSCHAPANPRQLPHSDPALLPWAPQVFLGRQGGQER